MNKFAIALLAVTCIALAAWKLPWAYNVFLAESQHTPFTMYSSLDQDFICLDYDADRGVVRYDRQGNTFTQEQTDSLLPLFYVRQLVADGRFPDSICGRPVNPKQVQETNFIFRAKAIDVNAKGCGLYPLLESAPQRVDLEMPDDVFRITASGIEFVDMESNTVNNDKSQIFTQAMTQKGFRFPAKVIAGNPSVQKDYDEGYLMIDAVGGLFHVKMVHGHPFVEQVPLADDCQPVYVWIAEFASRKHLGFIASADGTVWALERNGYKTFKTPIDHFDPYRDNMAIYGNMLDWTVNIEYDGGERYIAVDADTYAQLAIQDNPDTTFTMPGLTFTTPNSPYITPSIN